MSKPDFMMQTFIRTTQDQLWDALADETHIARYHFMASKATREGDTVVMYLPNGDRLMSSVLLKTEPKSMMECTFEPHWEPGIPASRTVFLLSPETGHIKLVIEHYDLHYPVVPGEGVADGWERWAAGLKTYLETGTAIRFNEQGAV